MPVAKETSTPRDPIPVGLHHAICYAVIDLGTQPAFEGGKFSAGPKPKIMITWEFPEERITLDRDGQQVDLPRALSQEFTNSLHEKAGLRKSLESWRGRAFTPAELQGFDLAMLVGVNCMLNITHKENGYEKINAITPLPKGLPKRAPENEPIVYDVTPNGPIPESIPEWIRKKIAQCAERIGAGNHSGHPDDDQPPPHDDSDIPF